MELGKLFSSPIWLPDGAADSNGAPNARERRYPNMPTLRQPDTPTHGAKTKKDVIPAKAGIHLLSPQQDAIKMDSRFRGNDD